MLFRPGGECDRESRQYADRLDSCPTGDDTVLLISHPAALDVGFETGNPGRRELQIIADLSTADDTFGIDGVHAWRSVDGRSESEDRKRRAAYRALRCGVIPNPRIRCSHRRSSRSN
jgi:hypothetical protein